MGMSQLVKCPSGVPEWPRVSSWLADYGRPVQIQMIDGQLAFPDEEPPPNWSELRIGAAAGMVTIKRRDNAVELTIWGNAESALQEASNVVALAFAELGRSR
jgi:hypothetical protein